MAKQTRNQIQYEKELKNLKRRIKYAETEKGLRFEEIPIPEKPEKIYKKDIEKLKSLRGENLWKYATYQEYEDEEPYINDLILQNVEELLNSFDPTDFGNPYLAHLHIMNHDQLSGLLEMAIADYGRDVVAQRLNNYGSQVIDLVDRGMYDSGDHGQTAQDAIAEFSRIINNGAIDSSVSERYANEYGW